MSHKTYGQITIAIRKPKREGFTLGHRQPRSIAGFARDPMKFRGPGSAGSRNGFARP